MTTLHQTRRLLDGENISLKLGQPHSWFENYRGSLEAIGFPLPCLPADQFGAELWDEHAIDRWLDLRMDPALQQSARISRLNAATADNWEGKLNERARSLSL